MSPIALIDGSEPPVLAIHGSHDETIPSFSSERFVAALQDAGVDAEVLLVDAGHGFDVFAPSLETPPTPEVLDAILAFVDEVGATEG